MERANAYQLIDDFISLETNRQLVDRYCNMSILDILGKSRSETAHSSFIAWLFNQTNWPCTDQFSPISLFLKSICIRAQINSQTSLIDDIRRIIYSHPEYITVRSVKTEQRCMGIKSKKEDVKVDLVVRCSVANDANYENLVIVIENKVKIKEHDNQTWNYYAYYKDHKGDDGIGINQNIDIPQINGKSQYSEDPDRTNKEKFIFLYLTPDKNNKCECPYYIHYLYQDLMDNVLQPIFEYNNLDNRRKTIIQEYLYSLSIPFIDFANFNPDSKDSKNIIEPAMAISKKDNELLSSFYDNNQALIETAITVKDFILLDFWEANYALLIAVLGALDRINDSNSEKLRELKTILDEKAGRTRKDNTKYSFTYNKRLFGPYNKTNLPKEIVTQYLSNGNQYTTLFKCRISDYNSQPSILSELEFEKLIAKAPSYKKRFNQIQIRNNPILYVSNQWDPITVQEFIKMATPLGFYITPTL